MRRVAIASAATLLVIGCARDEGLPTRHLFDESAESVWETSSVAPERVLRTVALPGRTTPEDPTSNPPLAIVDLLEPSSSISAFEVDVDDMLSGQLRLDWLDRSGAPCGLIGQAEHAQGLGGGRRRFRYDLDDSPCWDESVQTISLATGQRHRARVAPHELRLIGRTIAIPNQVGRPVGVTLGDELRSAQPLPPSTPWQRRTQVRAGDRLYLGVGFKGRLPKDFAFTVRVRSLPGGDVIAEASPLFPASNQWYDLELKLPKAGEAEIVVRADGSNPELWSLFLASPVVSSGQSARGTRPNIVLIVVDTLRVDHLSMNGYTRATSPRLDAWAARHAVIFEQAIAAAPTTLPSHASMFTGLDALRHGANLDGAATELVLLAERLRGIGYSTAAATGGGYLHPRYGLFQGFDRYRSIKDGHLREDELALSLNTFERWLDELPEPYFLFLHTYEVHSPYRPRQPHLSRLHPAEDKTLASAWLNPRPPTPDAAFRVRRHSGYEVAVRGGTTRPENAPVIDANVAIAHYDSSIAHVDEQLGTILDSIAERQLKQPTAIVFTSDHGEAFGEADHSGHGYLLESNLRVPLVISWPDGRGAGTRVARQVRSVDILPTLLEMAGVASPLGIDGVTLTPLLGDPLAPFPQDAISWAASTNYGLSLRLGGRAKATVVDAVWPPYHGERRLFLLEDDPSELSDRSANNPIAFDRALARLRVQFGAAAGVHLRFTAVDSITVQLSGAKVTGHSVKSLDDCQCFRLSGQNSMEIVLEAGQSIEVLLEGAVLGDLTFGLPTPGGKVDVRLDTARLDEVPTDLCSIASCPPLLQASISAKRLGPRPPPSPRTDPELEQQLKALGYVH